MKFPKQIYATIEEDNRGKEFVEPTTVLNTTVEVGEKKTVAVYELKELVTVEGKVEVTRKKGQ